MDIAEVVLNWLANVSIRTGADLKRPVRLDGFHAFPFMTDVWLCVFYCWTVLSRVSLVCDNKR